MAWIVGGLAVQMLTMKTVGFSIATGLLFAAAAKGFGKGPLWQTVPIGIVFSFAVWLVFAKGLQLTLPAGPGVRVGHHVNEMSFRLAPHDLAGSLLLRHAGLSSLG